MPRRGSAQELAAMPRLALKSMMECIVGGELRTLEQSLADERAAVLDELEEQLGSARGREPISERDLRRVLACAAGQSAAHDARMPGRHKEVGGSGALSAAVFAVLCIVPVPLSVGAAPLPPLGVTLAAQADNRIEQVEAPAPTSLASVDLDSYLGEALLDDRVDLQGPEHDDEAKHYVRRTFVGALRAHTVPHLSLVDRAQRFSFRLRAFAGRAPPAV